MSETPEKLQHLKTAPRTTSQETKTYSAFIKRMRILLPLIALGIIALVFSWNSFQSNTIEPIQTKDTNKPQSIGKNELLNPRFESMDQKNQPYMVTAERAIQGGSNDDLILLENPFADISLNDGRWLAAKSQQAAFQQTSQRLLMKGNVQLFHDEGYTLRTEEMDVDIKGGKARTDVAVQISGPAGLIDAAAMELDNEQDFVIFKGPAKLTLYEAEKGLKLETMTP